MGQGLAPVVVSSDLLLRGYAFAFSDDEQVTARDAQHSLKFPLESFAVFAEE